MPDGEELGLIDGSSAEEVELQGEESFVEGEGEAEGAEHEGEEQHEERQPAKRTGPVEVRKGIREILAKDPEFAKQFPRFEKDVTEALFKVRQIGQLGGLQKFQELAEAVEVHGGPEGIAALAEEVEAGRMLEQGFEQGDPAVIDGWAKDYPEGFKALVLPAIEKLEQMDLTAHDQIVSAAMWKTLDRCGVISTLNALESAIGATKDEKAIGEFNLLKKFFTEVRGLATRAKSPDPLKADRDKISQEREEVQSERSKMFYGSVRTDVNAQIMSAMNALIRNSLAGRKIEVANANHLRKAINAELARVVNTTKGYSEKYKAVMNAGDRDRAVQFIVSSAKQRLPAVVKQLVKEFNLTGGTQPRTLTRTRSASGGGNNAVAGVPQTNEVDFRRTDKATYLATKHSHGQAWRLDGKLAKW